MKIIHSSEKLNLDSPIIATIGMFDGVHVGHQEILNQLQVRAKQLNGKSVLISFQQHPRIVLYKDDSIEMLNSPSEKISLLEQSGIDYFLPLYFDMAFSELSALEFVRNILVEQLGVNYLIVGYDHQFGKNREGNIDQLKEYSKMFDFKIEQIKAVAAEDNVVSSTKIRKALKEGDLAKAKSMLGYDYFLDGKVEHGKGIGKKLGFPTANISISDHKLLPKNGVYIALVEWKNQFYRALVNIGFQPTFEGKILQVEAYILDLDADLYGQEIRIIFKKYLREEKTFDSPEALKIQLEKDKLHAIDFFNEKD